MPPKTKLGKPGQFEAGFPVAEKKVIDLSGKGWAGPTGIITYQYWTNFDRRNPQKWELVEASLRISDNDVRPPEVKWWWFKTNIAPEDFDFNWTEKQTKYFLMKMWEIYRYRKVAN